jgi:hypothetical protein
MPPGQAGISDFFDPAALEWAAKVERAVVKRDWPQPGQEAVSPFRISFSNLVPQSSQTYSKIGMLKSLFDSSAKRGVGPLPSASEPGLDYSAAFDVDPLFWLVHFSAGTMRSLKEADTYDA